ncbi:hypothetical protein K438DRAFT_1957509 [Mycena galopus ATCC 62051]|nr:hypothetical protein K438DRAFT_1957509 [Mycena galopus ATCC 62051]
MHSVSIWGLWPTENAGTSLLWVDAYVKYLNETGYASKSRTPAPGSSRLETKHFSSSPLQPRVITFCNNRAASDALNTAVPVVVVLTQFDVLYSGMEMELTQEEMKLTAEQIRQRCSQRADTKFNEICLPPLQNMDPTPRHVRTSGLGANSSPDRRALADLIKTTLHLLGETSGLVEYWRGIASSTRFPGFKLEKYLNTLHIDIVTCGTSAIPTKCTLVNHLSDKSRPDASPKLLRSTAFVEKMRVLTQVVVPREEEVTDWLCVALFEVALLLIHQ